MEDNMLVSAPTTNPFPHTSHFVYRYMSFFSTSYSVPQCGQLMFMSSTPFHAYVTGCRRFGAEKKSGAPSKFRFVAGAAKNLNEKQEKRVRRVNDTRRTIVFSFSLWKVSGFATKPNTLLRVFCPLPHGGAHGVRALPVGRDMRSHPVASSRWPVAARRRARDAHPTDWYGPMSKIGLSRLRETCLL